MTTQDFTTRPTLVPSTVEASPTELDVLWRDLGGLLTCSIDVSEMTASRGRKQHTVTVVATNGAPSSPDSLRVVFRGVGLEVVPLRPQGRVPAWADAISGTLDADRDHTQDPPDDVIPWPEASPRSVYLPGEVLYPGDSIRYEFRVPAADIPYYDYRLTAGLSWRHLFWNTTQFSAPDEIARGPFLQTLKTFNDLGIHTPLLSLLKVLPEFSATTSEEDVAPFRQQVMAVLPSIHVLRSTLLKWQETAPADDLGALLGKAADYMSSLEEACGFLHGGLNTGKVEELRAGIQSLEIARRTANELNETTERAIATYGAGDEEVGYRYR